MEYKASKSGHGPEFKFTKQNREIETAALLASLLFMECRERDADVVVGGQQYALSKNHANHKKLDRLAESSVCAHGKGVEQLTLQNHETGLIVAGADLLISSAGRWPDKRINDVRDFMQVYAPDHYFDFEIDQPHHKAHANEIMKLAGHTSRIVFDARP